METKSRKNVKKNNSALGYPYVYDNGCCQSRAKKTKSAGKIVKLPRAAAQQGHFLDQNPELRAFTHKGTQTVSGLEKTAETLKPRLIAGAEQLGLALSERQVETLLSYQAMLLLWNKAYNLTAIREPEAVLVRHVLDCLAILPHLPPGRLLDIGTGAGLPGAIVAIVQPERDCVLLDTNGKKIRFLRQLASDLKLANVTPVQARVEDPQVRAGLGAFAVVTSRAFADPLQFVPLAQPYLQAGGVVAAMTAQQAQAGQACPPGWHEQVCDLHIPGLQEPRHLILLSPDTRF